MTKQSLFTGEGTELQRIVGNLSSLLTSRPNPSISTEEALTLIKGVLEWRVATGPPGDAVEQLSPASTESDVVTGELTLARNIHHLADLVAWIVEQEHTETGGDVISPEMGAVELPNSLRTGIEACANLLEQFQTSTSGDPLEITPPPRWGRDATGRKQVAPVIAPRMAFRRGADRTVEEILAVIESTTDEEPVSHVAFESALELTGENVGYTSASPLLSGVYYHRYRSLTAPLVFSCSSTRGAEATAEAITGQRSLPREL
jgi:hypothetical protein